MLNDYRAWLVSELQLLGNASHHAYAFGQANMAERAIEKLDESIASEPVIAMEPSLGTRVLAALERLAEREGTIDPALDELRIALDTAATVRANPE